MIEFTPKELKLIQDSIENKLFDLHTGFYPQDVEITDKVGRDIEQYENLLKKIKKSINN